MDTVILSSIIGAVGLLLTAALTILFSQVFNLFNQMFTQLNALSVKTDNLSALVHSNGERLARIEGHLGIHPVQATGPPPPRSV